MIITPIRTSIVYPDQELLPWIVQHVPTIHEQSVLVITSKVVALAEGRHRMCHSTEEKVALMHAESDRIIRTPWSWLTCKDGQVYSSAGIDESNVEDGLCVLLPEDTFASAHDLQRLLRAHYGLEQLGVLITDSRTPMLRQGAVGITIGFAGFEGIQDYRTTKDLFGRPFVYSRANHADALAAAAVLTMGEGNESQPLALVTDAPIQFTNRPITSKELFISIDQDKYLPYVQELL